MKFVFVCSAMLLCSIAGFSQTKKIAHRSHSGKNSCFSLAGLDNFGETPEMNADRKKREAAEKAKADSLRKKAIADSLARSKKPKAKFSRQKGH